MFNFWRSKAIQFTLEQLVKGFTDFVEEYKDEKQKRLSEEQKEIEEKKRLKLEEEQRAKTVNIKVVYYPNKELFVIIGDDTIYSDDTSRERYENVVKLRDVRDIQGIKALLLPKPPKDKVLQEDEIEQLKKEDKEIEETVDEVRLLVSTGEFEVKGDSVHMTGIDRSIPQALLKKFMELHVEDRTEEFEALKNFWRWVVLNPNAAATESFYDLIRKYGVTVTNEGFILAYRWLIKLEEGADNYELIEFISNEYTNLRKKKKSTSAWEVWENLGVATGEDEDYNEDEDEESFEETTPPARFILEKTGVDLLTKGYKHIGNLKELYTNLEQLQETPTFTDGYTRKMKIKLGQEVTMDRKECDETGEPCSRGLHACFNMKDYSSHGNTKILVAICPRDIVSVPYNESKFRCCAYLPLAILKDSEKDTDFFQKGEGLELLENYFTFKKDELEEQAKTKTVKELTEQRLLPNRTEGLVSDQEVKTVINGLQVINQRIKTIS